MFVRFVVGTDRENPAWLTGIITEARILRDAGLLHDYEIEQLEAVYDWFNEYLPCPPFREKLANLEWTRDAVCWFRDAAEEPINRMWDIVAILREHSVPVRMLCTDRPGKLVYEDEFQVVAQMPMWA